MKWNEFYVGGIYLCLSEGSIDIIESLCDGIGLPAKFIVPGMIQEDGTFNEEIYTDEPIVYLVIRSIACFDKACEIRVIVKTRDRLPAGVRHGTYELTFQSGGMSTELPREMFEDEDVPHDILEQHRRRVAALNRG